MLEPGAIVGIAFGSAAGIGITIGVCVGVYCLCLKNSPKIEVDNDVEVSSVVVEPGGRLPRSVSIVIPAVVRENTVTLCAPVTPYPRHLSPLTIPRTSSMHDLKAEVPAELEAQTFSPRPEV